MVENIKSFKTTEQLWKTLRLRTELSGPFTVKKASYVRDLKRLRDVLSSEPFNPNIAESNLTFCEMT